MAVAVSRRSKVFEPVPLAQDWTTPATFNNQSASIAATTLAELGGGAGLAKPALYRLTAYIVVTTAATTSSSIKVSAKYTDESGAQTQDIAAAYTGNAVGGVYQAEFVFEAVSGTIQFTTTYASVGATAMTYKVWVALQRICGIGIVK